jgi:Heparinase II/III-like protein/Heparinase II/III N-terminus
MQWYAMRVQAMDAAELLLRARRTVEARGDAAIWTVAPAFWRRRWEPDPGRIRGSVEIWDAPLGFLTKDRVLLAAKMAPESFGLLDRAQAALEGRVRFFGYPEVRLGEPFDPSFDPVAGARWPDVHGKLLDYRRGGAGDPKWIWERNRCQELPLLCLAWHLTAEARFAETASKRTLAWITSSMPGRGIAWSNGFEAGLRGISFALTFDALRGSGLFSAAEITIVLRGLWQHAHWILRDHSFGSSANNHLIGEAAGLVVIGLLAPELKESGAWVAHGLEWLETEADRQVLPDGGGAEQAFAYHLFVCDLLLLVSSLCRCRGRKTPAGIDAALRRSGQALALQVRHGEPEPAYGDSDDGRAFLLDAEETRTAVGVAASLACAVGDGALAHLAGRPDLPALLLFGEEGAARFAATPPTDAPASGWLSDTGLVVIRRNGVRTTFDTGPLGYLQIAAHGHADALGVTFSDGSRELISDPGTGTYFGDSSLRHTFRSTLAHATVAVDGGDQALYGGPFLWLRHSRSELLQVDLDAGVAVGEVDAWSRLDDPVRHRRAVVVLPCGALLVYDRLDARLTHRYAQTWPLHPSLEPRERTPGLVDASLDGRPCMVAAFAPPAARVWLLESRDGMSGAWWSRRLERTEPASVVRVEQERAGKTEFAALFVSTRGAELDDPGLRMTDEAGATVVTFALDRPHTVRFDLDSTDESVSAGEAAP